MGISDCIVGDNFGISRFLFYKGIFKKGIEMKKKTALYFMLLLIIPNVLGCAPFIIGTAAGALGGYAVSKDTVQGETDKPYSGLWDSALTVSRIRGTIKQEDSATGYIELETDSNRVWIRLVKLTRATTRIKVSARNRFHLPNVGLAQEIFVKIIEEAR